MVYPTFNQILLGLTPEESFISKKSSALIGVLSATSSTLFGLALYNLDQDSILKAYSLFAGGGAAFGAAICVIPSATLLFSRADIDTKIAQAVYTLFLGTCMVGLFTAPLTWVTVLVIRAN